jgi:hypothetical protein
MQLLSSDDAVCVKNRIKFLSNYDGTYVKNIINLFPYDYVAYAKISDYFLMIT